MGIYYPKGVKMPSKTIVAIIAVAAIIITCIFKDIDGIGKLKKP